MSSAKSFGNSTLSCNVGSTRVPPECPWIARKCRKVQAVLKPFLRSSSFCQEADPSFNFNWLVRSNGKPRLEQFCQVVKSYSSIIFSMNCVIMSQQSDHNTSKQPSLNFPGSTSVYFRSRQGIDTGENVKVGFGRGLAFVTGFPAPLFSTFATGISSDVSFTCLLTPFTMRTQDTFLSRNTDSIMISTPYRPWWSQTVTSRTGQIFEFPRIPRLTWDDSSLRDKIYSRHDPLISSSVSSSSVMKNCPFSMFFEKPALEQSLVNFSWSGSSANFCSYSRNKFPCSSSSVWELGLAVGNSVGITIDSTFPAAPGSPRTFWVSGSFSTHIRYCSVDTELTDGNNCSKS